MASSFPAGLFGPQLNTGGPAPVAAPVQEIPVQETGGGFAALLQNPAIAQALLTAGTGMLSGQNVAQAFQGGMGTYQNLLAAEEQKKARARQEGREDTRLGLEQRRVKSAEDTAASQLDMSRQRLDLQERQLGLDVRTLAQKKSAALAKATTAAERAEIEARYKTAQIDKLTAETQKIKADMDTELKGTDPTIWKQALNTVIESTGLGDKPSVRAITAQYNTMVPEGKKVMLPFSSGDLKQALESSATSQMTLEEQVAVIQSNFGPKAAKRFEAALKKRAEKEAAMPVPEPDIGLFDSLLGK